MQDINLQSKKKKLIMGNIKTMPIEGIDFKLINIKK